MIGMDNIQKADDIGMFKFLKEGKNNRIYNTS